MLSDEEKKAIKVLNNFNPVDCGREDTQAIETILNLIEKQFKEIEELKDKNKSIVYNYEMVVDKIENSTPNDKIKAKIEEIENVYKWHNKDDLFWILQIMQSLLEKE